MLLPAGNCILKSLIYSAVDVRRGTSQRHWFGHSGVIELIRGIHERRDGIMESSFSAV